MVPTLALEEALVRFADGDRYLLERGGAPLARERPQPPSSFIVGPEGGIEDEERSLIVDRHGWIPASLGETTLRFETAAVVAVGMLRGLLAAR
jgi:16S rRNA U1498 N3-methylase RsmE